MQPNQEPQQNDPPQPMQPNRSAPQEPVQQTQRQLPQNPQPAAAPYTPTYEQSASKKSSLGGLKTFAIVAVILAVIGGSGYAMLGVFGEKAPQQKLDTAMQNLLEARKASATISYPNVSDIGDLNVTLSTDVNAEKSSLNVSFKDEFITGDTITVDAVASLDRVDVRLSNYSSLIDDALPLLGAGLNDPAVVAPITEITDALKSVDGKWWYVDEAVVSEITEDLMLSELLGEDTVSDLMSDELKVNQEDLDRFASTYKDHSFFVIVADSESTEETINNAEAQRLEITIDPSVLNRYIDAVGSDNSFLDQLFKLLDPDAKDSTQDILDDLKEDVNGTDFTSDSLFVWIDGEKIVKLGTEDTEKENIDLFISTGADVSIEEPTDSIAFNKTNVYDTLKDLFGQFSGVFTGLQTQAGDSETKTDLNSIHVQMEIFYNDFGYYPSANKIDEATLTGSDPEAFIAPNGSSMQTGSSPTSSTQYVAQVLPSSCDNQSVLCTSYTLSAYLEDGSTYKKYSLN